MYDGPVSVGAREGLGAPSAQVDVLIIGAGLSGIGAAHHLQQSHPGRTYMILEARDAIGGTWDLFRYPGIRSDSDMFTLGYAFKPWREAKAIADGPSILRYVRETAREGDIDAHIRFNHRVLSAEWSSEQARWTVHAERTDTGELLRISAAFVIGCTGYFRYEEGYTPELPGIERFGGEVVHPQRWSDDVDYDGKRVVVIGSGATAITLVPALADRAQHVTMLQRSPTYLISLPGEDPIANVLRRVLPAKLAYSIVRAKNVLVQLGLYQLSQRWPALVKRMLRSQAESKLPAGYDIDTHFKPRYNPWDQRLCLIPDGDFYEAIGAGKASVVTDRIETFTETGIALQSGAELDADLVITATGLELLAVGGVRVEVDGGEVELGSTVSYRGMMLCGVPNLAMTFGYTNASWTLRCDLTCAYVCRLLTYMDEHGYTQCTPQAPGGETEPAFMSELSSGYAQRARDRFPRQGKVDPWRVRHNYPIDMVNLWRRPIDDGTMRFAAQSRRADAAAPAATPSSDALAL